MMTTVISLILMAHLLTWFLIIFLWLNTFEYHVIFTYLKGFLLPDDSIIYFTVNGKQIPIYANQVHAYLSQYIIPYTGLWRKFIQSIWFSFLIYLTIPFIFSFFKKRSKDHSAKEWLRGSKLITPSELKKEFKGVETDLPVGNIKLPRKYECQHVFLIGSPGAGKTVFLNQVIERTMQRDENCVIYDFKGDFVSKFFRPDQDILFNPLDRRCVGWNIFNELQSEYDIDAVAASLIPPASGDNVFWNDGARDVFSAILVYLFQEGKKTNADVWEAVTMDIRKLSHILGNTKGAERGYAYIQDGSSKQAVSVHSVLMQYAKSFQYLKELDGTFSIQKWIQKPEGNIFIPNYANTKDTLKPILSLFVDLLGRQLLSLPDDINRRIFFFEDEFGTLQRMSTIVNLLTLGRSKGASIWIGIQDVGQIEKIYGRELRQTIINACGNSLILRVSDPTTSKYLSDKIGQCVINVPQESYSMGVTDFRDGVNLSKVEKTENLILPSELQNLPDLTGYAKFVGHNFVRIELQYKQFENRNNSFEEREGHTLKEQYTDNIDAEINPGDVAGFVEQVRKMRRTAPAIGENVADVIPIGDSGTNKTQNKLSGEAGGQEEAIRYENKTDGAQPVREPFSGADEKNYNLEPDKQAPVESGKINKENNDLEAEQEEILDAEKEKSEAEKREKTQEELSRTVDDSAAIDVHEMAM